MDRHRRRDHPGGHVSGLQPLGRDRGRPSDRAAVRRRRRAVRPRHGAAAGPSRRSRQRRRGAAQRRPDLPRHARGHPRRPADDHLRDLHLLVGARSARSSPRRSRSARSTASPCTCCSTGWAARRSTSAWSSRCARRESRCSATTRCAGTTSTAINNRTHRKLLVVDGEVGVHRRRGHRRRVARQGAGSRNTGATTTSACEGPVVAQMQAAFMDNWLKVAPGVLHGDDYFPPLAASRGRAGADLQELAA